MNLNKLLKATLKTGLYFLERSDRTTAPIRKQVREKVGDLSDRTRQAILRPDHTWRNAAGLAVGVGLGVAVGMLFAPASGDEVRHSLMEKALGGRANLQGRFQA